MHDVDVLLLSKTKNYVTTLKVLLALMRKSLKRRK